MVSAALLFYSLPIALWTSSVFISAIGNIELMLTMSFFTWSWYLGSNLSFWRGVARLWTCSAQLLQISRSVLHVKCPTIKVSVKVDEVSLCSLINLKKRFGIVFFTHDMLYFLACQTGRFSSLLFP